MQTVQFQCSHCGNMMGVTLESLGQEVRCPTCEKVVVAPASVEPSPPEPSNSDSVENMFLANLESAPIGDPPKENSQPTEEPAPIAPAPAPSIEAAKATHTEVSPAPEVSVPWHDAETGASAASEPVARLQRQAAGGISWLWLLPLLSYSILATAVAVKIYFSLQESNQTVKDQNKLLNELNEKLKARPKAPNQ